MNNQKIPNHSEDLETNNGSDAQQSPSKKRLRIPYSAVLSSNQFETDPSEIIDPEAEVTEEDSSAAVEED